MATKSKKQRAKASISKAQTIKSKAGKIFVLFGLDENEKPRAAKFIDANEDLVTKLAQAVGLRVGVTTASEHTDIVGKLPVGRIHAPGKASVPNISQDLYERLNAAVGGDPGRISTSFPKNWDEIGPGHLVIAQESRADGWWECVVVKRHDDQLSLRFRDFPDQGEFIRNVNTVALLRPDQL